MLKGICSIQLNKRSRHRLRRRGDIVSQKSALCSVSSLVLCPELCLLTYFCHENQRQKIRLGLQRQTARATTKNSPLGSIARVSTSGHRCRWHRRRGSYSRQSGETARREQCSNCKREYGLQNLRRGNWTYPSSSGGSPKHAERPPRHGARPLMHETPLAACDYRFGRGLRCSFGLPPEELG